MSHDKKGRSKWSHEQIENLNVINCFFRGKQFSDFCSICISLKTLNKKSIYGFMPCSTKHSITNMLALFGSLYMVQYSVTELLISSYCKRKSYLSSLDTHVKFKQLD